MKHKTILKKRLRRDCWDLDYAFYKWLRERLPVYLKEAGKIVDLECHKFTYKGKEWTQKEITEYLIQKLNWFYNADTWDPEYEDTRCEIHDIWKLISPATWW